jgi:5-methylcytosine-specific restriction endonuclease McrA
VSRRPTYNGLKRIARDELKNLVLTRDKYICQSCKQEKRWEDLTLHHRHGWEVGEFDKENLVTLCRDCHDIVHGIKRNVKGEVISYVDKTGIEKELR